MSVAERRAFTLLEVLLAGVLSLMLLGLLVRIFLPMSKGLVRGSEQAGLQQTASVALATLGRALVRTTPEGVSLADQGRALALQPLAGVNAAGRQILTEELIACWWSADQKKLFLRHWPPSPPDLGRLPQNRVAFRLTATELLSLCDESRVERVLATQVERFQARLLDDCVLLEIEQASPAPDGGVPERFALTRRFLMRNETP